MGKNQWWISDRNTWERISDELESLQVSVCYRENNKHTVTLVTKLDVDLTLKNHLSCSLDSSRSMQVVVHLDPFARVLCYTQRFLANNELGCKMKFTLRLHFCPKTGVTLAIYSCIIGCTLKTIHALLTNLSVLLCKYLFCTDTQPGSPVAQPDAGYAPEHPVAQRPCGASRPAAQPGTR